MLSLEAKAIATLGLIAILLAGLWGFIRSERAIGAQQCKSEVQAAQIKASEEVRVEEQRRTAATKEIADETYRMATRARADGAAADRAGAGLRDAFAARARACYPPAEPGVAPTGAAESPLLADLFGEVEGLARGYAREADIRGTAGRGCERQRDQLGG